MLSNLFFSNMSIFIAGLTFSDINLGYQEHVNEGPNETQNTTGNNDQKLAIELQRTFTCPRRRLEVTLEVVGS